MVLMLNISSKIQSKTHVTNLMDRAQDAFTGHNEKYIWKPE